MGGSVSRPAMALYGATTTIEASRLRNSETCFEVGTVPSSAVNRVRKTTTASSVEQVNLLIELLQEAVADITAREENGTPS